MDFAQNKKTDTSKNNPTENGDVVDDKVVQRAELFAQMQSARARITLMPAKKEEPGRHMADLGFDARESLDDGGTSEAPSTEEISDYFESHQAEIIRNLDPGDSQTMRDEIAQAVMLIATNGSGKHFNVTSGGLGHSSTAEYHGLTHSIFVSKHFSLENPLDRGSLIHEVVHAVQDKKIIARAKSNKQLSDRRREYWSGTGRVVITAFERSSIEAQIMYINSLTKGQLKKLAKKYDDYDQYLEAATRALTRIGAPNGSQLEKIAKRAYFYYGMPNAWPYYIQYQYECKDRKADSAAIYSPSLTRAKTPDREECDEIKAQAQLE